MWPSAPVLLQIYEKSENSIRLVLLDEAFSKMTSDRIRPMMELFRRLQLQVLLISTVEKSTAIQPYCDITYSIVRHGDANAIAPFIKLASRYRYEQRRTERWQPCAAALGDVGSSHLTLAQKENTRCMQRVFSFCSCCYRSGSTSSSSLISSIIPSAKYQPLPYSASLPSAHRIYEPSGKARKCRFLLSARAISSTFCPSST